MNQKAHHPSDGIRALFSQSLSAMYKAEVPLYGSLLDLVADINADVIHDQRLLNSSIRHAALSERLDVERHGAIRLGTAAELSVMRRLFAVMGMEPVGYYDLSVAGVPVHATAFRPVMEESLQRNPFRVFTSLLRLELIEDAELRQRAVELLTNRRIFTPRCLTLIERAESVGGLARSEAEEFVAEALSTFRWHGEATVDVETYRQLKSAHPLIADVVCFKGPHVNHLTPRVLDIDKAQAAMKLRGIRAKDEIEGPPRRACPILLRQTSFLALEEAIRFPGLNALEGTHTARFGEIEQRGCALTRKGRKLYDELLAKTRTAGLKGEQSRTDIFSAFPDDWSTLRREGLAYFRFSIGKTPPNGQMPRGGPALLDSLIDGGWIDAEPLIYEDFLPVSAAGIFRSNLGGLAQSSYNSDGSQKVFEKALGCSVKDEIALYEAVQSQSIAKCLDELNLANHAS